MSHLCHCAKHFFLPVLICNPSNNGSTVYLSGVNKYCLSYITVEDIATGVLPPLHALGDVRLTFLEVSFPRFAAIWQSV